MTNFFVSSCTVDTMGATADDISPGQHYEEFRQATQWAREPIRAFFERVKVLARRCDFEIKVPAPGPSTTLEEHPVAAFADTVTCLVVLRGCLDQRVKRAVLTVEDVHKLPPDELAALFEEMEQAYGVGDADVPPPPTPHEDHPPMANLPPPRRPPPGLPEGRDAEGPAPAPPGPTPPPEQGLAGLEANFASAALSLSGPMGPERQALVRDFLEVIRNRGSSVIKILAHFDPARSSCAVTAPAGRAGAAPPKDAVPPDKAAAQPSRPAHPPSQPRVERPPGGRQPDPGRRPKTPGPTNFTAAPDGTVNRAAYTVCRLCHLDRRRRGKRGGDGIAVAGRPGAISEGVSGLLSPMSPPSPIKLFLPIAPRWLRVGPCSSTRTGPRSDTRGCRSPSS